MPALVVWERLIVGGDDLRLVSAIVLLIRLVQIGMIIYILYHVVNFDHKPEVFVLTDCIRHEDRFWVWYKAAIAGCSVTLFYGVIGAFIEMAIFNVSGRGTPTEREARRRLVPLFKFNMVRA
mmetsp:Transcript_22275/g.47931  ORF Transcript_22275/g.47931 Transcript_22275/m.47931 type:complete len:122 (-) Transcript_22275:48-413(-)